MVRLRILLLLLLGFTAALPAYAFSTTPTEAAAIAAARQDRTAYVLPPAKLAKAEALSRTENILHFTGEAWGVLSLFLILQLGLAARMRNVANNLWKNRWAQGFTFVFELLVLTTLLSLPLEMAGHHIAVAYGLSVQHWGSWFCDQTKGFLLTFLFGGLLTMLLFWLIRKFPRRWWLPIWVASMVFSVIGIFLTPYVIDPLFNKFKPLQQTNPALVTLLEQVVARGKGIDIPPSRMFLMKASDKVTTLNAYVTGFGASKRVVVWDTSIAKATPDEIAFIFGHEMGHYVLGHIVRGLLIGFALSLVGLLLGFYLFQWMLRRYGKRWRIPAQDNWAALVVFLFVLSLLSVPAEPVVNTLSRQQEHAADVFGQEAVHGIVADPQATAQQAFQLLGENSYADPFPSPLLEFWTYSHPAIGFRAAFAKHYNPWAPGAAPKYFNK